jgi:hypothetical protein
MSSYRLRTVKFSWISECSCSYPQHLTSRNIPDAFSMPIIHFKCKKCLLQVNNRLAQLNVCLLVLFFIFVYKGIERRKGDEVL